MASRVPKKYPHALSADEAIVVLWAESPEEARSFIGRLDECGGFPIDRIFVAKRSGKTRSNSYIDGLYYRTSDDKNVDVYDEIVVAPQSIIDLVQWCTSDVILSRGPYPVVVVEDTTHIVRMNLFQRFPRIARAATLGVPSIILQGTQGLNFRMQGDRWGLYRYLRAFDAVARRFPTAPPLPLYYATSGRLATESEAQRLMVRHIRMLFSSDAVGVAEDRRRVLTALREVLSNGLNGRGREIPPEIQSIQVEPTRVVVRIGANPDKKSWHEKGSGQMDPYLGLVLAAKETYCYDAEGKQIRKLVVQFTKLPKTFWFFSRPETTALYKRLAKEFSDEVEFLG